MRTGLPAYGGWSLAVVNPAVFILLAFSFIHRLKPLKRSASSRRSIGLTFRG